MRSVRHLALWLAFWFWAAPAAANVFLYTDDAGAVRFTNAPQPKPAKRFQLSSTRWPRAAWQRTHWPASRLGALGGVRRKRYDEMIRHVAARHRVDANLIKAVIRVESDFSPHAVSPKGALGLMQLMPGTARRHQVRRVFDPTANVEGGTKHLRYLLDRYRGNLKLALAAYNAGEGAVDRYRGVPPYRETQDYVRRVLGYRSAYVRGG